MTTLRAHFDGHVFIPDEPVDLPVGSDLELQVRQVPSRAAQQSQAISKVTIGTDPLTGLPIFIVPPGTPSITLEDVRRAEDEEF